MTYMLKLAGLAVLAVSWIGIAGCSHDNYRDGAVYVPSDGYYYDNGPYYGGGYYGDGYYYRHHDYDYDRGRYGYHMQHDYDHGGFGHRDIDRGAGRHDVSRDVGRGTSRDVGRGGGGRGGGRR